MLLSFKDKMVSPIKGPRPPYSNPPIEPQFFQPSVFVITAITLGQTTTVTTSVNQNYVLGQQVRLNIPQGYGARQLNQQTGFVTAIPALNQVTIDIVSQNFDPFVNASINSKPQIVAIGDNNTGTINASGRSQTSTIVPGSFINISPL